MTPMARNWIDAEFEVIHAPLRLGDPHPTRKGWRYVGSDLKTGATYWYVPPRRWRLFLGLLVGTPLAGVAIYYGANLLDHYWPR